MPSTCQGIFHTVNVIHVAIGKLSSEIPPLARPSTGLTSLRGGGDYSIGSGRLTHRWHLIGFIPFIELVDVPVLSTRSRGIQCLGEIDREVPLQSKSLGSLDGHRQP